MTYKMSFRLSDVIRLVSNNIPNTSSATYHLLVRRLEKFNNHEKIKDTLLSSGDLLEFTPTQNYPKNQQDENKNMEKDEIKPPKRLTSIKNAERKLQKRRVMKANHILGKQSEPNKSDHNNNPSNPSKTKESKILPILPQRKPSLTRASTGISIDKTKSPKISDERRRIETAKILPSMTSPRTSTSSRYNSALIQKRRTSTNSYLPSISSELND